MRAQPFAFAIARVRALARHASAWTAIVAVLTTLGGGARPFDPTPVFSLQARAEALHARWGTMLIQGVPSSELVGLEHEWAQAERTTVLDVARFLWLPGASAILDRWQAQTAAVWDYNLSRDRAMAIASDAKLHQAFGTEPNLQRKERLDALAGASTPADFLALRFGWDLEAKLVPVDREIAAGVGILSDLAQQAKGLGISSDPASAVMAQADRYAYEEPQLRGARSGYLLGEVTGLKQDLGARLAAAAVTKASFNRLADEMSQASGYGVDVSGYRARVDSDSSSFSTTIRVEQFNAITGDLNQIDGVVANALMAAIALTIHIISGVSFYYQSHALSCEETATSMALTHQGIYLSQDQILAEMGADTSPMYRDGNGTVRWGNAYTSFVGSVDGTENYNGLQANYPPLVRVAKAHGATIIAAGSMSADSIYNQLMNDHPVVVYATWDWAWHPRHDYLSFDGRWIPWMGQSASAKSHVYTAVGVSPDAVLVNDSIRGQYWVGKGSFEAAYSVFSEAIVFA